MLTYNLSNNIEKTMSAKRADTPTINSEYDVAVIAFKSKKYTSIGTVKIEPPLPIMPKTT